jgi:Arc/MetJ-type ribon-helix-helix transcriptional regulator
MKKKFTFPLYETFLANVKQIVDAGFFRSASNLIKTALRAELARVKGDRLRTALLAASQDPLFLADIREVKKDFATVDFEEGGKRTTGGVFLPPSSAPSSNPPSRAIVP